ncbi:MAG: DUF2804 domain-containing protein, partial [Anaerolineae bacterium]|nr:DUF2804 domain-containing protein [Anaerolineae bacterium]
IAIDIRARNKLPAIQAEFTIHEDVTQTQPLIVVLPINNYRRPLYTHKAACPVTGSLRVGEQQWTFDPARDWALVDVQKTFYPYNGSFWKWAAFAGRDQDGVPVAVNLTHNMIRDDTQWNECCAWINGALHRLGAARFEYDPHATQQPWHITTTDGRVDLTFTPEGERAEEINIAGVVRSNFHQPFGTFRGTVLDDAGIAHHIDEAFGVTEHHMLKA